jgi:HEAT repeat protein
VLNAFAEQVGERRLAALLPELHARACRLQGVGAIGFCRAFAAFKDASAEPHLVRFLSDGHSEVQQEAASTLAALGTVRSVPPLLELTSGIFRLPQVKSAARHAVQQIQSRLQAGDVGDLALAAPEDADGELSLADEAGELSLSVRDDASKTRAGSTIKRR